MNQISPIEPQTLSIEEQQWQTRVDLAAAHRMCVREGFNEGIFNHLTARVPGTTDRYLQIPFGFHWSEVTASCFMEVGYDGQVLQGEGLVEDSAFGIHAPLHEKVPAAFAVFHTHMPYGSALCRLEDPRIKPIGQTEVGLMRSVAYDMDYHGPAFDESEGNRLVGLLEQNPGKNTVFMASHGILTLGSIAQAWDRLYYTERVAQVQLFAMWTGQPLKYLPEDVIETTKKVFARGRQYGTMTNAEHHFEAIKRILDRTQPDYKN
jgi:ribulose-5-phosphate 4-epimerase/fuculose-1-phosphate aldolase